MKNLFKFVMSLVILCLIYIGTRYLIDSFVGIIVMMVFIYPVFWFVSDSDEILYKIWKHFKKTVTGIMSGQRFTEQDPYGEEDWNV